MKQGFFLKFQLIWWVWVRDISSNVSRNDENMMKVMKNSKISKSIRNHAGIGAKHSLNKNGCWKFALILEKPEIDENLPTPLSWDAKLSSTGKPIDSSDFPKDPFRLHIKRCFWKVSAHLVKSRSRSFPDTCPENDEKWRKLWKNENLKIDRESFGSLP